MENDQEIEFQEIKIHIFHEIETFAKLIKTSKLAFSKIVQVIEKTLGGNRSGKVMLSKRKNPWINDPLRPLGKPGGLNLSRDRKTVRLYSRENLNIFKKFISTVEKSRSRSRFLDFVSASMSRPKSLDRDQEICRDLEILSFLNSLSRSRSRSTWIFVYFLSRFLNFSRLFVIFILKMSP